MEKYIAKSNGTGLSFNSDFVKMSFKDDLKKNIGARYNIIRITPESKKQRGFFEGAVIPMWVYLDNNDYRSSGVNKHYRDEAKKEFNGELIIRNGKTEKIGKSTKGQLREGFIDKVIDFLEEQYGIDRTKVLNPNRYKDWRDRIYPTGDCETYIEYMIKLKLL